MWLQAQQPGRSSKRGVPVFDEPLVNYMVGVREERPRLRVVDPVAVFPAQARPPPPQTFPRVFEQRDILVDDLTPSPPPPCTTLQSLHTVAAACTQHYHPPGPDALCHANSPLHRHAWLRPIASDLTLPTAAAARACPVLSFPSLPQRFAAIEFKCYSQNTEDGILLAIFAAIGTTNKRAVEIAGGLGWENNAINLVVNFGFDALFFDGDPGNTLCAMNFLRQHEATRDRVGRGVWWSSDFVTRENINALIHNTTQWEGEIDLFSLDMDGVDWWIWDALAVVRPRVVVVEIQELWGADEVKTRPYRADHVSPEIAAMGASLGAFAWLAAQKGYRLVGCIKQGFNAFFVREDVPGVDAVFGREEYARAGCFAHVDGAWRAVLEERRQRAGRYDWVDPREVRVPGKGVGFSGKRREFDIADTAIARTMQRYRNTSLLHAVTELIHPSQTQTHDLAILVLTCNRQTSLEALLDTLSHAQGIHDRPVYVSIDCNPGPLLNATQWSARGLNLQIMDSHQRHVVETGAAKARKDERVTRHWLHAVHTVLLQHEHVLYLEDDHLVHPAILHDADVLLSAQPTLCPACFAVQLGCHRDCWGMASATSTASDVARMEPGNMGVVYSRTTWTWFLQYIDEYCSIYGIWDVNLHHVLSVHTQHQHALTLLKSRVVHNSGCGSDRNTGGQAECDDAVLQQDRARLVAQDMAMDPVLSDRGTAKMPDMTIHNTRAIQADDDTKTRCMKSTSAAPIVSHTETIKKEPQNAQLPVFLCFCFDNELDLLHIKLEKLSHVVTKFIISESTYSARGLPKQATFLQHRHEPRWQKFLPQIVHLVDREKPHSTGTTLGWQQIYHVKRVIGDYLSTSADFTANYSDGVVIMSDMDEIASVEQIQWLRHQCCAEDETITIDMPYYVYGLHWKSKNMGATTMSARRLRHEVKFWHLFVENRKSEFKQTIRNIPKDISGLQHGVHCSYCGTDTENVHKLQHVNFVDGPPFLGQYYWDEQLFHTLKACGVKPDGERLQENFGGRGLSEFSGFPEYTYLFQQSRPACHAVNISSVHKDRVFSPLLSSTRIAIQWGS